MFCQCKDCRKMKRKGKILGTRQMGFWINNIFDTNGDMVYYYGNVSAYVAYHRYKKGRVYKRNKKVEIE